MAFKKLRADEIGEAIKMTQSYPLTITRNRGWYGKIRKLALYAETPSGNIKLGDVSQGQTVQIQVPQAASHIYGKMGWAKTAKLNLAFISEGETIYANA